MTITPSKPSTFRRSSENRKDSDLQEASELRRIIEGEAEEQGRRQAFEEIGSGPEAASVCVRPASMDEVFGDERYYDDWGVVR